MIDKEKVIKGLECCLPAHDPDCDLCPYDSIDLRCRAQLRDDVMALLKAQEPVVRCKDCKNGEPTRNAVGQAVIKCYEICDLCKLPRLMELDWYCADGERRENE